MTDTNTLIIRESLRAGARHAEMGHPGLWRECSVPSCRDAQNYVPKSLVVEKPAEADLTPGGARDTNLAVAYNAQRATAPEAIERAENWRGLLAGTCFSPAERRRFAARAEAYEARLAELTGGSPSQVELQQQEAR